jgi:glucokinase
MANAPIAGLHRMRTLYVAHGLAPMWRHSDWKVRRAGGGIIAHMGRIIAVDIGGTHMRAALYEADNPKPIAHQRAATEADKPGVYQRLRAVVQAAWPKDEPVQGIGISSPGPLDPHTGHVLVTPNIPEWHDFPLAPNLASDFGVPAFLSNDANLGALGEWKFGAARGHADVLYLTVSTGVGGGVIVDNDLIQGFHGLAAELGHTVLDPDGPICSCGFAGHLEAFASGPSIARYVLEQLKLGVKSAIQPDDRLTAQQVAEAAHKGDSLAIAAYRRAGEYLGIGVANFLHAFDPSIVILGGGVTTAGPLLFEPFEASLGSRVFYPRYLEDLKIAKSDLGDDVALLGALALAQISLKD